MFINCGILENFVNEQVLNININELNSNINVFENCIVYKKANEIKVYDRRCDHAGGKIISKGKETICPIHMWKFDPVTGLYNNGLKKNELEYSVKKNILSVNINSYVPKIIKLKQKKITKIRFFNHAFLQIIGDNFSFFTDPWAIGPAFNTGWWLKIDTKSDWIDELNNSNFIYISHNHPDHLHPLTLSKVNKKTPIVVPNYVSKSTEKLIREIGFTNIHILDFNNQYNLTDTDLYISILKSGDFREDSGIYFSYGEFSGLLSVDSNMLNFERFPKVDFYGSSFASGASGYPLMFDNYKIQEQKNISIKNKKFTKKKIFDNLKKITPKYFMPYAGFFETKLNRDKKIKINNQKNSINDYKIFCEKNNIKLIDVLEDDFYEFTGSNLTKKTNINKKNTLDLSPEKYLEYFKREYYKIDENYIESYFINSGFKDNLKLYICLTDDNFNLLKNNFLVDFTKNKIVFKKKIIYENIIAEKTSKIKKLILKIRKESFLNTIYNKLPWEDLLIGFQCKVLRNPNLYNIKFWNHFTNFYITSLNIRSNSECASCEKISHFFDNQIYKT